MKILEREFSCADYILHLLANTVLIVHACTLIGHVFEVPLEPPLECIIGRLVYSKHIC